MYIPPFLLTAPTIKDVMSTYLISGRCMAECLIDTSLDQALLRDIKTLDQWCVCCGYWTHARKARQQRMAKLLRRARWNSQAGFPRQQSRNAFPPPLVETVLARKGARTADPPSVCRPTVALGVGAQKRTARPH